MVRIGEEFGIAYFSGGASTAWPANTTQPSERRGPGACRRRVAACFAPALRRWLSIRFWIAVEQFTNWSRWSAWIENHCGVVVCPGAVDI
ncbi:hypothetical protein [Sphaerisporangium album]|uniref:hypothetical protein n=1 Tax=Sphaerisporangium album TaxID=509200 RepID=UPI0011C046C9|nr:hypothetical protein [Sphaerisporangium album]